MDAIATRSSCIPVSAFAARFTGLVGELVMSYVARWRMQVAVAALKEEGATVGQVAERLGYRSERPSVAPSSPLRATSIRSRRLR
jgi:AraC-like DNA-binding protein